MKLQEYKSQFQESLINVLLMIKKTTGWMDYRELTRTYHISDSDIFSAINRDLITVVSRSQADKMNLPKFIKLNTHGPIIIVKK